ncbi:MAG: nucleotidyltransferase domain-containing protein [Thermodesulfovibrio sp.]|nr:nucleotidyltransferase domain-containing protein [Thermodesulfovibrio sp.]
MSSILRCSTGLRILRFDIILSGEGEFRRGLMKNYSLELNSDEILKTLDRNYEKLSSFKVKKIGLFGSFARGKQNKKSDIDLFVEFEEPSFDNFMGLVKFLEKLFKRKVEIITPAGLESIRIKEIKENIKRSIIYVKTHR